MKKIARITIIAALLLLLGISGIAGAQNSTDETDDDSTGTSTTTTTTTTTGAGDPVAADTTTAGDSSSIDSSRPRIAVNTFENPPNYYSSTIGNGLTGIITTELVQSGRFNVIQRGENLGLLIDEIDLGMSGYIEPDSAVEMGHILGVQYILSGQVTNFGYEESDIGGFLGGFGGFGGLSIEEEKAVVRLDFALIDARTGTTVLAATAEGKESETGFGIEGGDWGNWVGSISWDTDEFMDSMIGHATIKAVDNLMDQILGIFPIQAAILAVMPDFLILDIGMGSGIEEGMVFDVFRITAVTNAAGEVVWEEKSLIGMVRVTEVELTGCKAEVISGSGFTEGDMCILPEDADSDDDRDDDDEESNPFR
jgi:curli biogenesis system outer membrane secretion channel CsgG